jgi:Arc/MetJ-type ribon-helix-helix transcriptional regulator
MKEVNIMARRKSTAPVSAVVEPVDPVDELPQVTISGAVPALVSEAVEGFRWANRMSRADVVKEALGEWAQARELLDDARARLTEQIEKAAAAAAEQSSVETVDPE